MKLVSETLMNDATSLLYTIKGSYGEAEKVLEIGDALSDSPRYADYVEYSESASEPYYIILVEKEARKIFEEDYNDLVN